MLARLRNEVVATKLRSNPDGLRNTRKTRNQKLFLSVFSGCSAGRMFFEVPGRRCLKASRSAAAKWSSRSAEMTGEVARRVV